MSFKAWDKCGQCEGSGSVVPETGGMYQCPTCAEVERLKAELAGETLPRESCKWSEDADGVWETECGDMFVLVEGPPSKNDMRYCCYCGRKLQEVLFVEPLSGGEGG